MIAIQGIQYDAKSSFQRGPAKAPPLIRERLWSDAYNAYAETGIAVTKEKLLDCGDFLINDYWDIDNVTTENLKQSPHLLTWGGDHSITYPVVRAFAKVHQDFDILHIDAHADLYDEFEGDPFSHACPFARIMEENLTNRLIQVGIRTLTTHQREQAKHFGVEVIEMKDIDLMNQLQFERPLYISLDIDGIDPAFAPGVSHQESGGLTVREVIKLIHQIDVPLIGADLVEYNPLNDVAGITGALCGKLSKELLAKMLSK